MQTDFVVIGGGVVGLSIAYGLLRRGLSVVCLDGSDGDYRASRGNFGLVWVQSKGVNAPEYARWTKHAVSLYTQFVKDIEATAGISISYKKTGGYEYFLDEESLELRFNQFSKLAKKLDDYPFEIWDAARIRSEEPMVGPNVVGATYYPDDGHINPLQLLHGLLRASNKLGLKHLPNSVVKSAETNGDTVQLSLENGQKIEACQVVIAAGLGAKTLGPMFGFKGLVRPQRGQVLVTEKLPPVLNRPSLTIRQVNEGAIQIGDSKEEVGFDDHTTTEVVAKIANRAINVMPALSDVRMVRTWGALRIMSPDGLPIYERSPSFPKTSLVTCHSGISLAAAHSSLLIDWLLEQDDAPNLDFFGEARFG